VKVTVGMGDTVVLHGEMVWGTRVVAVQTPMSMLVHRERILLFMVPWYHI
jgi:hypothetical protein